MTRLEHLLWILAEECAEVQQRTSKAARFGVDEIQPEQPLDNLERLRLEINDLFAAIEVAEDELSYSFRDESLIVAKKEKIEKFLRYSQKCGTLSTADSSGSTT